MTLETIIGFLTIAVGLATLMGYVVKMSFNMGQLSFQVKELWKVIFANSKVELVTKGLATLQSPLHIVSEGYNFIEPHLSEYLPIYKQVRQLSNSLPEDELERRLFQAFQQQAGEKILKQICIPRGLTLGAGIMAVIQACQWADGQGGAVKC